MEGIPLCRKKSRTIKRKKHPDADQLPLENIPEEISSIQDIQQICEYAAESVLTSSISSAVKLSLATCNDVVLAEETQPNSIEPEHHVHKSDYLTNSTPLELSRSRNDLEDEPIEFNESKLSVPANDDVDVAIAENDDVEDKVEMKFSASENEDLFSVGSFRHQLNAVDSSAKVNEKNPLIREIKVNDKEESGAKAEEQSCTLKQSVFVGKSKLYSSSLELGCHWDKTKFNLVLMPDLSKVVYPDLDMLLLNRTTHGSNSCGYNGHVYSGSSALPAARTIDRSMKPKVVKQMENKETKYYPANALQIDASVCNIPMYPKIEEKEPILDYKMNTEDSRFTDYATDEVDFRVFMNPVKWSPEDNHQLVVFRVGPLYYEEFFTNCFTTDGLVQTIRERATALAKHQLHLAQKCLLMESNEYKLFHIQNATVVIYECPSKFDRKNKWLLVHFGVNEAFYEENFHNCNSFDDVIKAVKNRAETICKQQNDLKSKVYSPVKASRKDSLFHFRNTGSVNSDTLLMDIKNYCFADNEDGKPTVERTQTHEFLQNDVPDTNAASETIPPQRFNSVKRKFQTVRKWFKDVFSKKTDKSASNNVHDVHKSRSSGHETIWDWNDTPENSTIGQVTVDSLINDSSM